MTNEDHPEPNGAEVDRPEPAASASASEHQGPPRPESERARILRMVSEGTISPDEAEQLLRALEPAFAGRGAPPPPGPPPGAHFGPGWGPIGAGPVPPVPPIPPVPPVPPVPPAAGPWQFHVRAPEPPDVLMQRGNVMIAQQTKQPRERQYALHFAVRDGEKRMEASLPLGLAQSADRFLPRQMRPYLEGFGVEVPELLEIVEAAGREGLPQWQELMLFEMKEGEKGIQVRLRGLG